MRMPSASISICTTSAWYALKVGTAPGYVGASARMTSPGSMNVLQRSSMTCWAPVVKRARIELAREETLSFVPPWYGQRVVALGEQRAARVALSGPVAPGLLAD